VLCQLLSNKIIPLQKHRY